jgi:hypothetical protein
MSGLSSQKLRFLMTGFFGQIPETILTVIEALFHHSREEGKLHQPLVPTRGKKKPDLFQISGPLLSHRG